MARASALVSRVLLRLVLLSGMVVVLWLFTGAASSHADEGHARGEGHDRGHHSGTTLSDVVPGKGEPTRPVRESVDKLTSTTMQVTGTVRETADETAGTVEETVGRTTATVDETVDRVTGPISRPDAEPAPADTAQQGPRAVAGPGTTRSETAAPGMPTRSQFDLRAETIRANSATDGVGHAPTLTETLDRVRSSAGEPAPSVPVQQPIHPAPSAPDDQGGPAGGSGASSGGFAGAGDLVASPGVPGTSNVWAPAAEPATGFKPAPSLAPGSTPD